jgi:platelet-activating factor acetylhydrolase IB subunit beta/gamma
LGCLNLGIGGDQTQHVLWRIANGELAFVEPTNEPKLVVLLVGTNNVSHTAEQVAEGVLAIVVEIVSRLIETRVLVVPVPPRGRHINVQRERIVSINERVRRGVEAMREGRVHVVPSARCHEFVNAEDGTISHLDMFDYLHFTNDGYRKFCRPILEQIRHLTNNDFLQRLF